MCHACCRARKQKWNNPCLSGPQAMSSSYPGVLNLTSVLCSNCYLRMSASLSLRNYTNRLDQNITVQKCQRITTPCAYTASHSFLIALRQWLLGKDLYRLPQILWSWGCVWPCPVFCVGAEDPKSSPCVNAVSILIDWAIIAAQGLLNGAPKDSILLSDRLH